MSEEDPNLGRLLEQLIENYEVKRIQIEDPLLLAELAHVTVVVPPKEQVAVRSFLSSVEAVTFDGRPFLFSADAESTLEKNPRDVILFNAIESTKEDTITLDEGIANLKNQQTSSPTLLRDIHERPKINPYAGTRHFEGGSGHQGADFSCEAGDVYRAREELIEAAEDASKSLQRMIDATRGGYVYPDEAAAAITMQEFLNQVIDMANARQKGDEKMPEEIESLLDIWKDSFVSQPS